MGESATCQNPPIELLGRKDSIVWARFESLSSINLRFNDGKQFNLPISKIPIDASRIDWSTASVSDTGEQMIVLGVKGDRVPIDAGTLRSLVDDEYAAEIKESLRDLMFSRDELLEMSCDKTSPPSWLFEPTSGPNRDSWK